MRGQKKTSISNGYYDSLTGLPNRTLFCDRLTQALTFAGRNEKTLAVMFLSVNNVKLINDTLGRDYGDEFLRTVAEKIRSCLRKSDTVARPGRNEFMILLPQITRPEDAALVADKIFTSLDIPFIIKKHELFITTNIGISIYPHDGKDAVSLIKNSYTAMQSASEIGKNIYQFYSKSINDRSFTRMVMTNNLRLALKRREFLLHYQPQIDLDTGMINGIEALVRWNKPGYGVVYPGEFIHLMEETGLILPLGEWVLNAACVQNKVWQEAGLIPLHIAVNISARQFHQQNLIETISRVLEQTNMSPDYLELELTESVFIRDFDNAVKILKNLKDMGIRISIDDFGTGYSSLSYLKHFPADKLKLVESFVSCISIDSSDFVIASAIVAMAHSLNMKVIVEGIENEEHLQFLHSLKCDAFQGNLFSRPIPAEEMTGLLTDGKTFIIQY